MQIAGGHASGTTGVPHERKLVLLLCVLAAIHVFVFCAAFPFFNNVDESVHFDLILRYAHGEVPRGPGKILKDSIEYIAFYNSWSYDNDAPGELPNSPPPPPLWTEPPDKAHSDFQADCTQLQIVDDYEASQPPLYYSVAGAWWDIGKGIGIHGGHLLYWLRFFNVIPMIALVWLAYVIARIIFPENVFMRLGVPAVLALMPQTAFYSLGNDIFSPLCFGATFLCLIQWLEKPSWFRGVAIGLAFAATWLSKTTNLPMLAIIALVMLFKLTQDARNGKLRARLPGLAAFICCAGLPIILWMLWSKAHYGDFTGSQLKIDHFGWTVKPFGDWWPHPIFTPAGMWTYLSGQLSTFWQGEFYWHNQLLALPGSRALYTVISLVLICAAMPALLPRSSTTSPPQRRALLISLLCFVAGLGFFALLSTAYDFHDSPNPSRVHPYFQAGRMILGALIPFLLLIVYGLDRLLARFGDKVKFAVLAAMICAMLAVEITTDWSVFSNPYNWFHLP